jgi:hypothetical protein
MVRVARPPVDHVQAVLHGDESSLAGKQVGQAGAPRGRSALLLQPASLPQPPSEWLLLLLLLLLLHAAPMVSAARKQAIRPPKPTRTHTHDTAAWRPGRRNGTCSASCRTSMSWRSRCGRSRSGGARSASTATA